MNIAICDDDSFWREEISNSLKKFTAVYPQYDMDIFVFDHADDLFEAAGKKGGFDIYILDVIMPDTDGIELGVSLRENGYDGKIIYLTVSMDHVLDSFNAEPYNYLIKPIDEQKFFTVLKKAMDTVSEHNKKSIIVRSGGSSIKITLDSIIYIELFEHTILYHLRDGRKVRSKTIRISFSEAVKELLDDSRFCLCGTSIAVNMEHISEIRSDTVLFNCGYSLQFARKVLNNLDKEWYDYCTDGSDYDI